MRNERDLLEQALEVLEAQRPVLGPEATEAAMAALRARITALASHVPLERRHVTVLFGDLCGFTALSEGMDPEDVGELMNRLWERVDTAIFRHGGRIDKHIGDAVMALWGTDGASEDDAERAIHAALDIHSRLAAFPGGPPGGMHMRIGIHTGPVLLGVVGTLGELTVMGDTVNTASRLEQAAPPDGILVSHVTYRHVSEAFEMEPQAPLRLKGKQEPLQVYRVTAARPRAFQRRRGLEGVWARLVGREEETRMLRASLQEVLAGAGTRAVTLTGEAGIGKSRLLGEFETWLESLVAPPLCLRGRASPEMRRHPNALLRDLFSFHLQVQESDSASVIRARLEESFQEALGPGEGSQIRAHLAGSLIGFDFSASPHLKGTPMDEQSLRARGLTSLTDYFRALLRREPMVLFLEDIHWADDSALDLLERLLRPLTTERLLVVCTARPEFFERRPHWSQASAHLRLELSPLTPADSHRLLSELLRKVERIPPELEELVVTRAEGNPFYLEELIQMLLEEGVILVSGERWRVEARRLTTLKVPPTLSGVLQSRLDSLPPREREVLQRASVVGRLFWDESLLSMDAEGATSTALHDILAALQERELIFEQSNSSFSGAREYIFKHAIVREVAYDTVLKRERRAFHGCIAEWLLARGGERSREHLGLLADHLEAAGQGERAATSLRRAAEEALGLFAHTEARAFLERALALCAEDNHTERYAIVAARERVHSILGNRREQRLDLDGMESLAERLGDERRQTEAALRRSLYALEVGEIEAGEEAVNKAIRLAQELGDVPSEAIAHLRWGRMLRHHQGDFASARVHFERSLTLAESARLVQVEVESLLNLSATMNESGELSTGLAHIQRVIPFCQSLGDRWLEISALRYLAYAHKSLGEFARARADFEQTLQFSRVIGYRFWETMDCCNLARLHHHLGDPEGALEWTEQGLRLAEEIGSPRYQGYVWMSRGLALISLERLPEAREAFQQSRRIRVETRMPLLELESMTGLAAVELASGQLHLALEYVEQLLPTLEGNTLQGVEEPFWMWLTCFRILRAHGDRRALLILEQAHQQLQAQVGKIQEEAFQRSFLGIPTHRSIREEWRRLLGRNGTDGQERPLQ
ncbi:ATP-binding protein [Melittangium boletus]|uniref:Adenylate cyclase n=1 Tax=Melittangium boletus DSM 14713 TaxID=1294270 RepID=A0A250IIG7_9BACT|nr:adenylate/guanylate cyclase domain-containing protein [Melittangium boletus]ATB30947.1 adenylate cyclase [Melittangium boletus DSM 14713]